MSFKNLLWPFIMNIDVNPKLTIVFVSSERVQIEDPRLEWRALQEDMLRQYLVTAQDDLTNKQELVTINSSGSASPRTSSSTSTPP